MGDESKLSKEELAELREQLKNEASFEKNEASITDESDDKPEEISDNKIITITISEDMMKAYVRLSVPLGNATYVVPELMAELRKNRVISGIQTETIINMVNLGMYDEDILVAEGKDVTPGTEGYYEFLIDMEKKTSPDIREDGSADYASMTRLINVAKGDKIAIYHPAVQGQKGYNVCGAELLPKYAKELAPLRGKYIEKNDDNEYFATIDGKISRNDLNIEILNVYEINEDLDFTRGTIEFYGDMIVNGNVESGVVIRAGRNLTINGTVAGAKIYAGGDVILSQGIQGNDKGMISARGSIFADFIEHARVESKSDVHANYFMNSKITAMGKVIADGSRGLILGGDINGLRGVEARDIGNITEPVSFVHAGFSLSDYEHFSDLNKKEKEINDNLAKVIYEMSELLKIGRERGVNQKQKDRIFELKNLKDEANLSIEKIIAAKKELGEMMALSAGAYVAVRGTAYRNTTVSVGVAKLFIDSEESFIKFISKNDLIEKRAM